MKLADTWLTDNEKDMNRLQIIDKEIEEHAFLRKIQTNSKRFQQKPKQKNSAIRMDEQTSEENERGVVGKKERWNEAVT